MSEWRRHRDGEILKWSEGAWDYVELEVVQEDAQYRVYACRKGQPPRRGIFRGTLKDAMAHGLSLFVDMKARTP